MMTNVPAAANAAKRERLVNRQAANVAEAVALAEMASAMQLVRTLIRQVSNFNVATVSAAAESGGPASFCLYDGFVG